MSWADWAKKQLSQDKIAIINPRGNSMKGKIESGDTVTVEPCDTGSLKIGDIVLVKVKGKDYIHLIKAVDKNRFLIGNNKGRINGWVGSNSIYGKATKIEGRTL